MLKQILILFFVTLNKERSLMKYDCKYLDESVQEEALKLFRRTYPSEFKSEVIDASDDK